MYVAKVYSLHVALRRGFYNTNTNTIVILRLSSNMLSIPPNKRL